MRYVAVVVTCNRVHLLKKCINNLLQQTLELSRIIVVNNGKDDETYSYLESLENDKIASIHLETNCGGAGGFYAGIEIALKEESDFVILLDDDAILDKRFCECIDVASKRYPQCKAFCGTVETNNIIDTSHRLRLFSKLFSLYREVPVEEYSQKDFECDFLSFCGAVISTELIKIIGLPRKEYFIWYDDMEYSCRIREKSEIINVNNALINHCRVITSNTEANWRLYYGVRNRFDMVRRHMGRNALVVLYLRTFLVMLEKYALSVIKEKEKYRYIASCYKLGMYDAIRKRDGYNKLFVKE